MFLSSQGGVPIGTILAYTGDLNKIPSGWYLCDGTNGTPDLRGRFLEGVTTDVGNFIEAGLPNITGFIAGGWMWGNGVFRNYGYVNVSGDGNSHPNNDSCTFDASRCSPIYGNSDTVQPPAYTVYYIIRLK